MVRVGLVGCGFMGQMHATVHGLLQNSQLIGVFDASRERGQAFVDKHHTKYFQDFESLAAECDVIDICLPTYRHCEFTVTAAALKKHVLCEKPMALNMDEARTMKEACEKADVRLMIAHCIRFWPEYALLKQIAITGHLGDILSLNLTRYGEFPHWGSNNWLADESRAGGGALDMHIHCWVNLRRFLVRARLMRRA
jgi:predicted dehydrogenase